MTEQQDRNIVSNIVVGIPTHGHSITLALKNQERSRTSAHKGYPVPTENEEQRIKKISE